MRMRIKLVLVFGVLFDEASQLVGIMNGSWGLDSSNSIVVEETEFESQSGDHHLDLLDWYPFILSQIILNYEVVRR